MTINAGVVVANVGTFAMNGRVSPSGQYVLTFTGVFPLTKVAGRGTLTLTNDGMQVQFDLDSRVMNAHVQVGGWISYTGTYTLQGDFHTGTDGYDSSVTFTLTQAGMHGHAWAHFWTSGHYSVDGTVTFDFNCWTNAGGGVEIQGSGSIHVHVHTPWYLPDYDADCGFSLSNLELHISTPRHVPEFWWYF
jgi:hypothetical protein